MRRGTFRSKSRVAAGACLALSLLAILLWGKLKLVTGVPRTAYAEPGAAGSKQPVPAWRRLPAGRPAQERTPR